jgi:hypothetical protein
MTNIKWNLFIAAALLTSYILISRGVSIVPVVAGCLFGGLLTILKARLKRNATGATRESR